MKFNMKPIKKGYLVDKRLSASQMASALKGYSDYYTKYILGISFSNKYTRFGQEVHEMIQNGELEIGVAPGENEKAFLVDYEGILLNGFMDRECVDHIAEIKTSKDISSAKKYRLQCDLYQFVTKKPVKIFLVETQEEAGTLSLTGNYKEIEHDYNEHQLLQDIAEAVRLIETYNERYQSEEVDVEAEKLTAEYQMLLAEVKELEVRKDEIKAVFSASYPTGYKSVNANVFYTERKTYELPEELEKKQADLKLEIDAFKESSKNFTITKSITIK